MATRSPHRRRVPAPLPAIASADHDRRRPLSIQPCEPRPCRPSSRRRRRVEFVLDNLVWIILVVVLAAFSARHPELPPDRHLPQHPRAVDLRRHHRRRPVADADRRADGPVDRVGDGARRDDGGADLRHRRRRRRPRARSGLARLSGVARDGARDRRRRSAARNGFLVVRFGINAFIVTLASYILARGRRGRDVRRPLGLRPARRDARHGDRAPARRPAARLDADRSSTSSSPSC